MTHPIRWTKWRDVGTMYSWNNWTGNSKCHVYFWIKISIWETAHLPLPLPNINPHLLSVDCRWVKGGVGKQLLECGHWSRFPYPPPPHNPPPPPPKKQWDADWLQIEVDQKQIIRRNCGSLTVFFQLVPLFMPCKCGQYSQLLRTTFCGRFSRIKV